MYIQTLFLSFYKHNIEIKFKVFRNSEANAGYILFTYGDQCALTKIAVGSTRKGKLSPTKLIIYTIYLSAVYSQSLF